MNPHRPGRPKPDTDNPSAALICIVDDDPMVCESLRMLCVAHGYRAAAFTDCPGFLAAPERCDCDCLILDVRLPGIGGPELQERLLAEGDEIAPPIIFISGHGTLPLAVKAMRLGALDFLQKPFDDGLLLERVEQAVKHAQRRRQAAQEKSALAGRLAQLSAREKEVLAALLEGFGNKQIADRLGISIRTVEQHRGNLKTKLHARSLAELLKKARAPDDPGET